VTIVLPFEDRPRVFMDAVTEGEAERLADWLYAHDYLELVDLAHDLAERDRAA
jgi:hypothetical protein